MDPPTSLLPGTGSSDRDQEQRAAADAIRRRMLPAALLAGLALPGGLSARDAPRASGVPTGGRHPASPEGTPGFLGPHDVRRFGAIGDAGSHPVSEWLAGGIRPRRSADGRPYADLAAIRADHPHVRALTDEIDWAAMQAAVDAAQAAGGGVVQAPGGVFVLNRTVWFPESSATVGTAARDRGSPERGVSFAGAGEGATFLCWRTDLGEGHYAFDCRNRRATGAGSAGFWRDFTLSGPGTNVEMGTHNCGMSGLGWGSRRHVANVWSVDFRYGLGIVGDQGLFQRYSSRACHYGIYFDAPNPTLFGDHQFDKCVLHGRMAAVGIHPRADMPKGLWNAPVLGAAPYGIFKEIDPAAPNSGGNKHVAMVGVTMVSPQFENIGMEAISGGVPDRARPLGEQRIALQAVRLVQPQFGGRNDAFAIRWPAGHPQAGRIKPRPAMISAAETFGHLTIEGMNEEQIAWVGDEAMLSIGAPRGLRLVDIDLDLLLAKCRAADRPFLLHSGGGVLRSLGNPVYLEQLGRRWWGGCRELATGHPPPREGAPLVSAGGLLRTTAGTEPELAELQFMGVARMVSPGSVIYAAGGTARGLTGRDGIGGFLRVGLDGRLVAGVGNTGPRAGTAHAPSRDGRVVLDLVGG